MKIFPVLKKQLLTINDTDAQSNLEMCTPCHFLSICTIISQLDPQAFTNEERLQLTQEILRYPTVYEPNDNAWPAMADAINRLEMAHRVLPIHSRRKLLEMRGNHDDILKDFLNRLAK